jgi:nucleoside-diphosphate-sugar epimerase
MNFIITGANGFIGRALSERLLGAAESLPAALRQFGRMTLLDLNFSGPELARVRRIPGSIADPRVIAQAFDSPVDVVFHLASVPGGMAEQNYELARKINLDATVALLEAARAQAIASSRTPIFVFASSIAVLGSPLPNSVNDDTAPHPALTYGAQKWIGEILMEDFHRRGWIRGRALRLPGIVARPPQRTGQLSAFLSDIIRELALGNTFACPVSADSTTWLMSLPCVVDNLLHAATMPEAACMGKRVWTLPALRTSMTQLVEAIAAVYDAGAAKRVTFVSNLALEANFGRHPPLSTPAAERAGFKHDGDVKMLVRHALQTHV